MTTRRLRGARVAVLDFETTSPDPLATHPVQVAIAHLDLGVTEPVLAFQSLIRPPCAIPAEATAIHGISDFHVKDAPTWEDVEDDIAVALAGRVLAAYNLPFDWQILHRMDPLCAPFGHLDPLVWVKAISKYEKGKRLSDECARRGIPLAAHDAGADALATAHLLPLLLRDLVRGRERLDKYGRAQKDGPWCSVDDVSTVEGIWSWTTATALEQERDFAAYRKSQGQEAPSLSYHTLLGVPHVEH